MKKWILITSLFLLIILIIASGMYLNAVQPVKAEKERAVKIAKEETSLTTVDDFHVYNGEDSFSVIQGKDKKGTKLIVWVPEKKGKVIVKKASSGITRQQAIDQLLEEKDPDEIISAKLGMENDRPIWEIRYRADGNTLNYYFVGFLK